ncbi:MAG: phosphate regulon sensor histidine kinase PhoR [Methylotenera sp.]|nr:phosphate regulon sensor histidine kinase PhoR [Methylotenera sp.]MDP1960489.1 phosphate regulon sensor histidine kinase PhoR [Methylotenera sp.]MDP3303855.1 phosphate regulon sensor histidine kinase PhoR [Methylotenera sp.]MDP3943776.1 phosphate regulon sensor histidine kinase PhoR [Methylotenera sp.]
MLDIRWKAGLFIGALSTICIFLWLITSTVVALVTFSLGVLVYLVNHIYWLHQLQSWLKTPVLQEIPEGSGLWEDVYTALLKYERNNHSKETELSSALERFNITANAIPDGLVLLGAANEIEWCTKHAENQLGLNLATDQNLPIVNLIRNSHFIAHLYSGNFVEPFILTHCRNSEAILEIFLIPLASKQKLLISRDVTQIEKTNAMRRDFIANVSHELRTPLTVVGGFIETLSDMEGAIPENIRSYFNMMQDQTTRMRRLIEDLLTLSQIESNTQPPEDTAIEMSALINMMLNDANALSQGNHKISADISKNLNLVGAFDELQSALSNLVSNAIRYTPKGGEIQIRWHLRRDQAVFSVSDNGIGIPQQHIDRLTERFYRVDRGRSRETGGTGLGLSIVKHILTRHQAKLEIESEVGVGSTFSAIFPKARAIQK